MKTKKSFQYWQWRVIICSMIGYSVFYFVRKNFAFAMPALGQEYGITDTSFGVILTLVGLVYGVSKFLNGFIADRANARWHLVIGLGACVILNFLFGWSEDISHWITGQESGPDFVNAMVAVMAVLLVLNNVFQGAGFGPCNRLMVHWVPPKKLATKMSIWNMSHSIGAAIVSIVCGSIVASMGWRWCFWIPAAIGAGGVAFIILTLRDTPSSVGLPELPDTKTELDDDDTKEGYRKFVMDKVFKNPVVWIIATTALMLYIVRFAVLDWGPKFLQQGEQQLYPQLAGWTIGIFEIAGCAGMLLAGWISDRFFAGKAQRVCVIEMILVAVCLVVLQLLPPTTSPVVVLCILALAGFFLYGPQALLGVVASKHATKKAASAAVGLIGLMSYVSVLITGAGLGWFSDHFGWNHLFILMAGFAILGGILVAFLWNIKDDGYLHE